MKLKIVERYNNKNCSSRFRQKNSNINRTSLLILIKDVFLHSDMKESDYESLKIDE